MSEKRQLAEDWLKYAIKNWRSELTRLKVGSSDDLYNSFKGSVIDQAGGDRLKLEISYAWYGQMLDMGVGRGTKAGQQQQNNLERRLLGKQFVTKRKPKRWYSKGRNGIGYQTSKLSELLGMEMASRAVEKISGSIDEKIVINF